MSTQDYHALKLQIQKNTSDIFLMSTQSGILFMNFINYQKNKLDFLVRIKPHECSIRCIFANKYQFLTAGSQDEIVCVYNTRSLVPKTQILDFGGDIQSLDVILDKFILIGLKNGNINVQHLSKKELEKHKNINAHSSAVLGMLNNGKIILTYSVKDIKIFNIKNFKQEQANKFMHISINKVYLHEDKVVIQGYPNRLIFIEFANMKSYQVNFEDKQKIILQHQMEKQSLVLYENGDIKQFTIKPIGDQYKVVELSKVNIIQDNQDNLKECIASHPLLSVKLCKISNNNLIVVTNSDQTIMYKINQSNVQQLQNVESNDMITNIEIMDNTLIDQKQLTKQFDTSKLDQNYNQQEGTVLQETKAQKMSTKLMRIRSLSGLIKRKREIN